MFLTAGGYKIPANELDQHVSLALHLLAALADPEETKKAAAEITRIRDEALEYAGNLAVLKNAQQQEQEASQLLIQATAQSQAMRENAAAEVKDRKQELAMLERNLAAAKIALEETTETAGKISREADQYVKDKQAEADKLLDGAKNVARDTEELQDNARALKLEFEQKIANLKKMVGG